jgi:hypothetical protein
MAKNFSAKKLKAGEVSAIANSIARDAAEFNAGMYAGALVSPKSTGPVIFPSVCPSRCGAALFPLVVEVTTPSEFGIICEPSMEHPLRIAQGTVLTETNDVLTGTFSVAGTVCADLTMQTPCTVQAETIGGRVAVPFYSSAGTVLSLYIKLSSQASSGSFELSFSGWNGSAWVELSAVSNDTTASTIAMPAPNWTSSYTFLTFNAIPTGSSAGKPLVTTWIYSMVPQSVGTCAPIGSFSMDTFVPDWATVLLASQRARVVAMDCLVTYEGSTLNNGGSIAVCNTDDQLTIGESFYSTIASRPHDMYRGRLASEGETEGGAHWHFVPDSEEQLIMQDVASLGFIQRQNPYGYFGIKGKTANEVVRIEVHIMLNFYSTDPSFVMSIQPPMTQFPALLYALRKGVPLVSSNDSHLSKLSKWFKKGLKKGIDLSKLGLQFAKDHDGEIAKALMILSKLAL